MEAAAIERANANAAERDARERASCDELDIVARAVAAREAELQSLRSGLAEAEAAAEASTRQADVAEAACKREAPQRLRVTGAGAAADGVYDRIRDDANGRPAFAHVRGGADLKWTGAQWTLTKRRAPSRAPTRRAGSVVASRVGTAKAQC